MAGRELQFNLFVPSPTTPDTGRIFRMILRRTGTQAHILYGLYYKEQQDYKFSLYAKHSQMF